jgi:hypothetical protein
MAKQVKRFAGSSSATMSQSCQNVQIYDNYGNPWYMDYQCNWNARQTTTIYTVPSGRIAKVRILDISSNSNPGGGAGLHIGNTTKGNFIGQGRSGSASVLTYSFQNTNTDQSGDWIYMNISGYGNFATQKNHYLSAGESIYVISPVAGTSGTLTITYDFLVVEEY